MPLFEGQQIMSSGMSYSAKVQEPCVKGFEETDPMWAKEGPANPLFCPFCLKFFPVFLLLPTVTIWLRSGATIGRIVWFESHILPVHRFGFRFA